MAASGIDLIVKLIGMIGDAKAWRLHVRMWAHIQAAEDRERAEQLETWVHDAARNLGVFGGQRREALRMWAYEIEKGDVTPATDLYDWAVLAEGRDSDDPPQGPTRPGGFDTET